MMMRAFLIGTTLVSAWTWIAVFWPIDGVLSAALVGDHSAPAHQLA